MTGVREARRPTDHQIDVLSELEAGGSIAVGTSRGYSRWHLVDRNGSEWRDAIRQNTVDRLMDELWIERADVRLNRTGAPIGQRGWLITAAGRLALARQRGAGFGLVLLNGGKA